MSLTPLVKIVDKISKVVRVIVVSLFPRIFRHFKEIMKQQSKKDETRWKLLVSKVMAAKIARG